MLSDAPFTEKTPENSKFNRQNLFLIKLEIHA